MIKLHGPKLIAPSLIIAACALLSACGGGGVGVAATSGNASASTNSGTGSSSGYTISGNVTGLHSGTQVTLNDNGTDTLNVTSNGSFTFKSSVANAGAYAVTVGAQPSGETCSVSGGSGTVTSANVTAVVVTCSSSSTSGPFTIGGTVSGLSSGTHLTLLDNGGDTLTIAQNGTFSFATSIAAFGSYTVTVGTQPSGQTCTILNNADTQVAANVTDVAVDCSSTYGVLYSFDASPGGISPQSLIQGSDGNFYGVTTGKNPYGVMKGASTLFKITPAGTETVVYNFASLGTNYSATKVLQGQDGNFYGIVNTGATSNASTIFKVTSAGVETSVYSFPSPVTSPSAANGAGPLTLLQGADGNFYGTTSAGGANSLGVIFKLTPAGVLTVLHSFASTDGTNHLAMIQASDGNFYGTSFTGVGNSNTNGTVFKFTSGGQFSILYQFTGGSNGSEPLGLIQGANGNLYGITSQGGASTPNGVLFELTTSGSAETTLVEYGQATMGPGTLLQASNGDFYGVAAAGIASYYGALYKVTSTGVASSLHNFGATPDGNIPNSLIQAQNGILYGTTSQGGTNNTGTVFFSQP